MPIVLDAECISASNPLLPAPENLRLRPTLLLSTLPAGELTGLLRDPGSKILSFDNLAMFDPGEDNWEKMLAPVSEWPTEFFG